MVGDGVMVESEILIVKLSARLREFDVQSPANVTKHFFALFSDGTWRFMGNLKKREKLLGSNSWGLCH